MSRENRHLWIEIYLEEHEGVHNFSISEQNYEPTEVSIEIDQVVRHHADFSMTIVKSIIINFSE